MKKDTPLKYQEINRLLLELRELLPELEFRYCEKTGLLEALLFDFKEESSLDLNFFDSLPRSYPSPNLLRRSNPHSRGMSASMIHGSSHFDGHPMEILYPRPRGASGLSGRESGH